jgi:hypothetical protein
MNGCPESLADEDAAGSYFVCPSQLIMHWVDGRTTRILLSAAEMKEYTSETHRGLSYQCRTPLQNVEVRPYHIVKLIKRTCKVLRGRAHLDVAVPEVCVVVDKRHVSIPLGNWASIEATAQRVGIPSIPLVGPHGGTVLTSSCQADEFGERVPNIPMYKTQLFPHSPRIKHFGAVGGI